LLVHISTTRIRSANALTTQAGNKGVAMFIDALTGSLGINVPTLFVVAILITVVFGALSRQKYPDVPSLRISKKPGFLGTWEDARLWATDALSLLLLGYEQYSSKGQHYLVSRPEGKLLVVAPEFVEEVRRAPESHVQNAPANNEVAYLLRV
jgi:hypothetical protein